jgi:tRNA(fMet)-specific endonuclease VapC
MYIIDTSIFSYLFRNDPIYEQYAEDLAPDAQMFLSVQTLGELLDGAIKRGWGEARKTKLHSLISTFSLLPITEETAAHYSEVMSAARNVGRRLDVADAWIMATARQFNLVLVSHDQDMVVGENIGVQIICRRKQTDKT